MQVLFMKTIGELHNDILKITMTIHKSFPELSKYLNEMPVSIPNESTPEIDNNTLQDYLNSLNNLLATYTKNHHPLK